MDETTLHLTYPVSRCWMKRAQQRILPSLTGSKQWTSLIGTYDWLRDEVVTMRVQHLNRNTIMDFLTYLLMDVYPQDNIVLIMDHAAAHTSLDTLAFLALFEHRVRVIWLPKYAPELNLIERFWQHLKKTICAHRLYYHIDDVVQDVQDFIALQNAPTYPERILFSKNFL